MWWIKAIIRDEGDSLPLDRIEIECELGVEVPLRLGILLMELLPEVDEGADFTIAICDEEDRTGYRMNGGKNWLNVLGRPSRYWRIRSSVWPAELVCEFDEDVPAYLGLFVAQTLPYVESGSEFTVVAIGPGGGDGYMINGQAGRAFFHRRALGR